MGTYTVELADGSACDPALAGGKGANLAKLTGAGFPVPQGFVVTTAAYTDFVQAAELRDLRPDQLHSGIRELELPEEIAAPIRQHYRDIGAPPVAVRSSGTAEDLADASFAGQHDTYLRITGEQAVLAAVRDCWASLWTPRAVAYRARNGWDSGGLVLAVVVQRMVEAKWAGVLFTADPVSGRRDRIVFEAVEGPGEALVSGEASGKHVQLDKATLTPVAAGSPLPAAGLAELGNIAVAVEKHFGCPQDIEWTYTDGHCALVQARPLTALPNDPGPASGSTSGRPPNRKRSEKYLFAADHVPHPPYPMDWSVALRPAFEAILGGLRRAGLTRAGFDDVFTEIAGADSGVVQLTPPRLRPSPRTLIGLPPLAARTVALAVRTSARDWQVQCDATLLPLIERIDNEDLRPLSDQDLLDHIDAIRGAQAGLLASRFACLLPRALLADKVLQVALRQVAGTERAGALHDDLLAGIACTSRQAKQELERLGAVIAADPKLRAAYAEEEPGNVEPRLQRSATGRALLEEISTYLANYGYRQPTVPMIGFAPLRETPEVLHGMLAGLAKVGPDPHADVLDEQRRVADGKAELSTLATRRRVAAGSPRRRAFGALAKRLLPTVRAGVAVREDSHFYLFMTASAVTRRVLLEFGRRLAGRDELEKATDVFYLRLPELTRPPAAGTRQTALRRKAARDSVADSYTLFPADELAIDSTADALHGVAASRGTTVGRVRVVRGEHEFGTLASGEILVCPYTNPAWTPLFALARGVVADMGGAASHAAIVAREYGIPAVMATGAGTRLLADGQLVRVDGDNGTVVPVAG